jgi:transposase
MRIKNDVDKLYDTDLTDAAWSLIAPILPAARTGGRPRKTNLRAVLNAIFYLLRTGCQWRLLPREFPSWNTVYHYFRSWKNDGVWTCLQRTVIADAGHQSIKLVRYLLRQEGWRLQIVRRRQLAFKITGLTWIVERSFAWLCRNRR